MYAPVKSSVGSRSMTLRPDSATVAFLYGDERSRALRSTWITRLRLTPLPAPPAAPPSAAAASLGRPNTVSTDESRTPSPSPFLFRRPLSPLPRKSPASPPPSDSLRCFPPAGFGPFQLRPSADRNHRGGGGAAGSHPFFTRTANEDGKKLKSIAAEKCRTAGNRAGVYLSPFFQLRPPRPAGANNPIALVKVTGNTGIVDPDPPSSRSVIVSRPTNNRSQRPAYILWRERAHEAAPQWPAADPGIASTSAQLFPRSRGAAYRDGAEDATAGRAFCDPHQTGQNNLPQQSGRQHTACLNESEEPFSYWNMGRFRRTNIVTSVSPAIALTSNLGRKRNANTDDFIPIKCTKLCSDD